MKAFIGIIGVIIGACLTQIFYVLNSNRKSKEQLRVAAFKCLIRLQSIEKSIDNKDTLDKEIYYLGAELNDYIIAISINSKNLKQHWNMIRKIRRILIEHDLKEIREIITEFEAALEVQ